MSSSTAPSRLRSLLLWLPVFLPLLAGAVALRIGLPYRDWDWVTVLLLLLASWGASVGVFSGWILTGMPLLRALAQFTLLLVLAPAANALVATVVGAPVAFVAFLLDATPHRLVMIALTSWFLVAAAGGVELLDRHLRRDPEPDLPPSG